MEESKGIKLKEIIRITYEEIYIIGISYFKMRTKLIPSRELVSGVSKLLKSKGANL